MNHGAIKCTVDQIATGIECGRDCKTSPYKFCTGLSINLYHEKIGNTDPVRETRLWYNLIGEVVQSLYGLLFEQTSPFIPVAIDCTFPTDEVDHFCSQSCSFHIQTQGWY